MEVKYEKATILIKRGILKGKPNLYIWIPGAKYSIFSCNFES